MKDTTFYAIMAWLGFVSGIACVSGVAIALWGIVSTVEGAVAVLGAILLFLAASFFTAWANEQRRG